MTISIIFQFPTPVFAGSKSYDISNFLLAGRTLGEYVSPLLNAAIVGAGVIAFILVLAGGLGMITSAGNTQQQEKGKNAATAGVMGLVLVISAYWIIRIIEVITSLNILNPGL